MRRLLAAARKAACDESWYGALALSLTLPDIAGKIDAPSHASSRRYVEWCEAHLEPLYTDMETGTCRLRGGDVYALRCAFLHEGSSDISRQRARQAYRSFRFIYPPPNGIVVHGNRIEGHLQLQVNLFCDDVFAAVTDWLAQAEADRARRRRLDALMKIEMLGPHFH